MRPDHYRQVRRHLAGPRSFPGPHPPAQTSRCFSLPVAQTFPLAEIAEAHRVSENGHVRGKLVLLVG